MKISIFTCLKFDSPDKGLVFKRVKVTADIRKGCCSFYAFDGSEHDVCNHEDKAVSQEQRELFQACF